MMLQSPAGESGQCFENIHLRARQLGTRWCSSRLLLNLTSVLITFISERDNLVPNDAPVACCWIWPVFCKHSSQSEITWCQMLQSPAAGSGQCFANIHLRVRQLGARWCSSCLLLDLASVLNSWHAYHWNALIIIRVSTTDHFALASDSVKNPSVAVGERADRYRILPAETNDCKSLWNKYRFAF